MYEPFIDMSMVVLESLCDLNMYCMRDCFTEIDITFQQSDWTIIIQNHSIATSCHKPNVIVTPSKRQSNHSKDPTKYSTHASNQSNRTKKKKKPRVCW